MKKNHFDNNVERLANIKVFRQITKKYNINFFHDQFYNEDLMVKQNNYKNQIIYCFFLIFIQTCLEWFLRCIGDLQAETQKDLFTHKILKTEISKIKEAGMLFFLCFCWL